MRMRILETAFFVVARLQCWKKKLQVVRNEGPLREFFFVKAFLCKCAKRNLCMQALVIRLHLCM